LGDLPAARRTLEHVFSTERKASARRTTHAIHLPIALHRLRAGGWIEPARQLLREMLPVWRRLIANGGEDSYTAHLGIALALVDEGHGTRSDAEEALREAKRSMELMRSGTTRSSRLCSAWAAQAMAHHLLGQDSEAVEGTT
jgi:hypothetical protein